MIDVSFFFFFFQESCYFYRLVRSEIVGISRFPFHICFMCWRSKRKNKLDLLADGRVSLYMYSNAGGEVHGHL